MKKEYSFRSSLLWRMAFILSVLLLPAALINAQTCTTVTFAQFTERFGSQDFVFTNSAPVSSFETVPGGSPVFFDYQNIVGLPAELTGSQTARAFFSCTTSSTAFTTVISVTQPFNNTCTIQIIREVAASVGTGSRTNLLTATIVNNPEFSNLSGNGGGNSAGYSASTPNQGVTFSSDFINFTATQQRNLALAFSSITPNFSVNPNGFLNSFTAAGAGTFASCPAPTFNPPTAASAMITGRVLTPKGTGLAKSRVSLTTVSGETFTTMTNSFGYYRFADVSSGQSVVISVASKKYSYAPKVVNVGEDLSVSDFMPER
jgi:hypothetical protein